MSNEDETTPKPTEEPKDAAAPRQRKIVRRSMSTRDNPAFTEAPPAEAAAPVAATEADPAAGAPAAATPAAPGGAVPNPRPRATFDARAPRPRPAPGDARPSRPARPQRGGDYRPPPARPVGARPIPGGPRAPASDVAGDYRPPPARPVGARPIPGGPRAPAPPQADRRDRRPPPQGSAERPAQARSAPVVSRPAAPPPAPIKAPGKVATPKPMPVFIPLARAGQVAPASAKPALTPKEALAAKTKAHAPKSTPRPAPKHAAPESGAAFDAALVGADADGAVAALAQAGDAAVALIDAWAAASNGAAIAEAAESDAVPGAARKAARRALNVLRSRGVAVPTRTRVVKMDDRAEVSVEATLISPDGQGSVVLTITSKDASGRYHLGEVVVREPFGILQAASGWLSGSQIKENRTRTLEGYGVAPASVPVEWARYRVAAARKLNAISGQVLPLGLERCGELLEPAPEAAPPHPVADLEADLTTEQVAAAAAASAHLHTEPEFRGWFPDGGALDDLLRKVGERMGGVQDAFHDGVASDPKPRPPAEAFEAALHDETEAATDRFFSPEVRALVASRMRDAAISVRSRKGDRAAAEVVSVARAVLEAGLITAPPREIPFLVRFFEKGIAYLAQQDGGRLRIPVAAPQPSEAPPA